MNAQGTRHGARSWAFYDWANSAFATVVLAGFFPLMFQDFWSQGVSASIANLRLGWANAAASLLIIFIAPLAGSIADRLGAHKRLLLGFTALGVLATISLSAVGPGNWQLAAVLFVLASLGFLAGNIFYDALLVHVAPRAEWDALSGLGFGLGYLGGGLLYLGCVVAVLNPAWLGLASAADAVLLSFVVTGVWWAVFSLPLAVNVTEPVRQTAGESALAGGVKQLRETLKHIRQYREVWVFLLAYWLYIDALGTTIRMAVAYGRSLGFAQESLIVALLITQFVGFPAAIAMGWLGARIGARNGILLGIGVYLIICIWGAFIQAPWEFYAIAALVGLVQGGVQSLSRSYYAKLIPAHRAGEFFGFYNLLGKFAALIGPPLFGLFGVWFGDVRYSMLALILMFVAGAIVLMRVESQGATT
ncbi:MFS transporter [Spiribacter sp. C176]|uniref:MFS transporter n=1 Tax=Spiribacter salilacus TaxID=2664894 RepID=A0A6N7QQY8_9GAMM|nr:MFS transporter [Spiribacter salilacus]MRH77813.1 MFS transporter [Spiribacter salilacus]